MVRAAVNGRSTPSQQVDPCSREGVALLRVEEEELLVAGDRPQRGRGGRAAAGDQRRGGGVGGDRALRCPLYRTMSCCRACGLRACGV